MANGQHFPLPKYCFPSRFGPATRTLLLERAPPAGKLQQGSRMLADRRERGGGSMPLGRAAALLKEGGRGESEEGAGTTIVFPSL